MQLSLYNEVLASADVQENIVAEPGIEMLVTKIAAAIFIVTILLLAKKIKLTPVHKFFSWKI